MPTCIGGPAPNQLAPAFGTSRSGSVSESATSHAAALEPDSARISRTSGGEPNGGPSRADAPATVDFDEDEPDAPDDEVPGFEIDTAPPDDGPEEDEIVGPHGGPDVDEVPDLRIVPEEEAEHGPTDETLADAPVLQETHGSLS